MSKDRCPWPTDELYRAYHDQEWGVPNHDDRHLFEMLILEGAQAGLSWSTILKKRDNYRKALHNFDAEKIARYSARDVERLMGNEGIVRNRLKISATIQNAKSYLKFARSMKASICTSGSLLAGDRCRTAAAQ